MASEASRSSRRQHLPRGAETAPLSARQPLRAAVPIDVMADASLAIARDGGAPGAVRCDACDRPIEGEPAGRGVFVTARGAEARFEEPALCDRCATAIGLRSQHDHEIEEEEG